MRIFPTKRELNRHLANKQNADAGIKIGFVPTMGALHLAHISLVAESKKSDDITVVSIFVNPNQFNNPNDLKLYPRTLETDYKLLEAVLSDDDVVFVPDVSEIYPEKDNRVFDFGNLDKVLEGEFRPGHFNGVAQVVSRLFDIVKPDRAYFGEKDFQQLAVIKMLVDKYMSKSGIEIVPVQIMREDDGLAMSSRNVRLTNEQRVQAPTIYKALNQLKKHYSEIGIKHGVQKAIETINLMDCLEVEYLEVVNQETFEPVTSPNEHIAAVACIAVFAGDVRLIDNIKL